MLGNQAAEAIKNAGDLEKKAKEEYDQAQKLKAASTRLKDAADKIKLVTLENHGFLTGKPQAVKPPKPVKPKKG